jgi:hypothetical protein
MAPAEKATDPHADIAQDLNTLAENLCGNQTVRARERAVARVPPHGHMASPRRACVGRPYMVHAASVPFPHMCVQPRCSMCHLGLTGPHELALQMAKQQLVLTRGEAAYYVWRQAVGSETRVSCAHVAIWH